MHIFSLDLYNFVFNDSFFLIFLISPEKRNLEPSTIRNDVGHPVCKNRVYSPVCLRAPYLKIIIGRSLKEIYQTVFKNL